MPIVHNTFGANGYNVGYIGTVPDDALARWKKGDCPLVALKGQPRTESDQPLQVVVSPGTPFLYAFASTNTGAFPTGTQMTVTYPNGSPLQPGDTPPGSIVYFNGNSVQCFVIPNPTPGTWELTASISQDYDADAGAHFWLSTMPTGNQVYEVMIETIEQQLDKHAIGAAQTADSLGCWACTIAAWAVVIVVAVIMAVLITAITLPENAAALAGVAAFLGLSTEVTAGLIIGAATAVSTAVGFIAGALCSWVNACEDDITVAIGTPHNNAKLSGTFKIAATTTGADSVTFTLDSSVLGNVTQGPPFKYFCTSSQFHNGAHTIYAMAIAGEKTALSAPVAVTFNN
jgi:hypothetical protein